MLSTIFLFKEIFVIKIIVFYLLSSIFFILYTYGVFRHSNLVATKRIDIEKTSSYECGFNPYIQARTKFNIKKIFFNTEIGLLSSQYVSHEKYNKNQKINFKLCGKRSLHIIISSSKNKKDSDEVNIINYGVEHIPGIISRSHLASNLKNFVFNDFIEAIFTKSREYPSPYIYKLKARFDCLDENLEYKIFKEDLPQQLHTQQMLEIKNFIENQSRCESDKTKIIYYEQFFKYCDKLYFNLENIIIGGNSIHLSAEIFNRYLWAKALYYFTSKYYYRGVPRDPFWSLQNIKDYYINLAITNDLYFSQIRYEYEYDCLNAYLQLNFLVEWCQMSSIAAEKFLFTQQDVIINMLKRFNKIKGSFDFNITNENDIILHHDNVSKSVEKNDIFIMRNDNHNNISQKTVINHYKVNHSQKLQTKIIRDKTKVDEEKNIYDTEKLKEFDSSNAEFVRISELISIKYIKEINNLRKIFINNMPIFKDLKLIKQALTFSFACSQIINKLTIEVLIYLNKAKEKNQKKINEDSAIILICAKILLNLESQAIPRFCAGFKHNTIDNFVENFKKDFKNFLDKYKL